MYRRLLSYRVVQQVTCLACLLLLVTLYIRTDLQQKVSIQSSVLKQT
jgi:hypothetical protein